MLYEEDTKLYRVIKPESVLYNESAYKEELRGEFHKNEEVEISNDGYIVSAFA
jgi:hypothetical protein